VCPGVASTSITPSEQQVLTQNNVWWLQDTANKSLIPTYQDPKSGGLKELTLQKCVQLWGLHPPELAIPEAPAPNRTPIQTPDAPTNGGSETGGAATAGDGSDNNNVWKTVTVNDMTVEIPRVPRKYLDFLRHRQRIFREIDAMGSLDRHPNVLALLGVCEMVENSSMRIFLILEIAEGGALFDHLKEKGGVEEASARNYMQQLLAGTCAENSRFWPVSGITDRG
jgi:serine/threonine protein kinase